MQNEKKPVKREDRLHGPYIYLQHDEQTGIAMCGCMLDHSVGGDPRFWQCNLHEHADRLLYALQNLCLSIECEPKDSPNVMAAVQGAYNAIEKAKRIY